jgi:hypothetical protein
MMVGARRTVKSVLDQHKNRLSVWLASRMLSPLDIQATPPASGERCISDVISDMTTMTACTFNVTNHVSELKEGEMLKSLLVVAAVSVSAGLIVTPVPAFAQNGKNCEEWCTKVRCAPGNVSYSIGTCMARCVPACNRGKQK